MQSNKPWLDASTSGSTGDTGTGPNAFQGNCIFLNGIGGSSSEQLLMVDMVASDGSSALADDHTRPC